MPQIDVNGATLDYVDTGSDDRPVLVLLHGWLGTWDHEFGPEIAWLRAHFRVLAPTLRGYGRSLPQPRRFSRDFYERDAADVAAWLDALDVTQAHIAGYSDGGEIAILLPILRPELVRSAAAWGATGFYGPELRSVVQRMWPPSWLDDETRALHAPQPLEPAILSWINAMKQIIDSGGDVSLGRADTIQCPVLLMLGRDDPLNPVARGRDLAGRIPRGKLVLFDGGHDVHRQQPEAFRRTLWDHLRLVEPRIGR